MIPFVSSIRFISIPVLVFAVCTYARGHIYLSEMTHWLVRERPRTFGRNSHLHAACDATCGLYTLVLCLCFSLLLLLSSATFVLFTVMYFVCSPLSR